MKKIASKKSPISEKVTAIAFFVFFCVLAILCIYPFFWAFNNALKTKISGNSMAITRDWAFENFSRIFSEFEVTEVDYFGMLWNSLWMLVVRVFVNVAASAMLAYAIARFRFPGKEILYVIVIFVNTIPIIGSGPAAYKLMYKLDFVENPALIWISWASGFDFAFIVLYGYFKGVSPSYSESAYIDGAGELRVFFSIILPQVVPCISAIMITQAIGVWNDFGTVELYLTQTPNLAYGLKEFEKHNRSRKSALPMHFAASIISSLPIIVLYSCTQNLILTNMTAGGLKG